MVIHLVIALGYIAVFKLVHILSVSYKRKPKSSFKIYNLTAKDEQHTVSNNAEPKSVQSLY